VCPVFARTGPPASRYWLTLRRRKSGSVRPLMVWGTSTTLQRKPEPSVGVYRPAGGAISREFERRHCQFLRSVDPRMS